MTSTVSFIVTISSGRPSSPYFILWVASAIDNCRISPLFLSCGPSKHPDIDFIYTDMSPGTSSTKRTRDDFSNGISNGHPTKRARSREERELREDSHPESSRKYDIRTDNRERDRYRSERDDGRHGGRERDDYKSSSRRDYNRHRRHDRTSGRDRHDRDRRDGERRHDKDGYSRRSSRPRSESRPRHSDKHQQRNDADSEKEEGEYVLFYFILNLSYP